MNISFAQVQTPVVSPDLPTATSRTAPAPAVPVVETAVVAKPAEAPPEPMAQKQLEAIASQLQEFLSSSDRDIEFRVDADTKAQVVTVRDARSGEVIRQFPNADALRVLKNLAAQQGTLFNGKA
jgi:flagellar protein FlaG